MQTLTISDFGVYLGKHSERLVVKKGGEKVSEHPLTNIEQVLVTCPGVSISSDLIHELCERGIPITFLTYSGKPYAKVVSPSLTATVKTRREQIGAFNDSRGVQVAKSITSGKLKNQANLLRYFAKYRKQSAPDVFKAISARAAEIIRLAEKLSGISAETADDARQSVLNMEGLAGQQPTGRE